MKIIRKIRAGTKYAPALLLVIYYVFILLDIYTTFLATPDLKYESNWMVRCFNLTWNQLIIKDILIVIFMTVALILSSNYLNIFFQQKSIKKNSPLIYTLFKNKKLLSSYIVLGTFYSHLVYSVFVCMNNYLGYIFIYQIRNVFSNISNLYINNIMIGHPYFILCVQLLTPIPGFLLAGFKLKRTMNKYILNYDA